MTNFFSEIAKVMSDEGLSSLTFQISKKDGKITGSILPTHNVHIQAVSVNGTPEELDKSFFAEINKPLEVLNNHLIDTKSMLKSIEEAKAKATSKSSDKEETKASKPAPAKVKFDPKMKLGERLDKAKFDKKMQSVKDHLVVTKVMHDDFERNLYTINEYAFLEVVGFFQLIKSKEEILAGYEVCFDAVDVINDCEDGECDEFEDALFLAENEVDLPAPIETPEPVTIKEVAAASPNIIVATMPKEEPKPVAPVIVEEKPVAPVIAEVTPTMAIADFDDFAVIETPSDFQPVNTQLDIIGWNKTKIELNEKGYTFAAYTKAFNGVPLQTIGISKDGKLKAEYAKVGDKIQVMNHGE